MNYTVLFVHRIIGFKRVFAFLGMFVLRFPLWFSKKCQFFKLMGCGKDGSVHLPPDFNHWACLTVWSNLEELESFKSSFVIRYLNYFSVEKAYFVLKCVQSRGSWDQKEPFFQTKEELKGPIAILTRATIYMEKVKRFKAFTSAANDAMQKSEGFMTVVGMGENPVNRQVTFSIWENIEAMKNYAFKNETHYKIIQSARKEQWYKEELFARFEVVQMEGVLNGKLL